MGYFQQIKYNSYVIFFFPWLACSYLYSVMFNTAQKLRDMIEISVDIRLHAGIQKKVAKAANFHYKLSENLLKRCLAAHLLLCT